MSMRDLRESVGLTQEQVAEYIGVTQATVSGWESGRQNPRVGKWSALAELYDCTVEALLSVMTAE